jgi:hypothetical protein
MKKQSRVGIALVLSLALSQSACMGSFVLLRTLYDFNSRLTDSKIINNIVFWALVILPVYSLATLGDACILNLIEFWTGKNLLASNVERLDDGSLRLANVDGATILAVPIDDTHVQVTRDGVVLGVLERAPDGSLVVYDASAAPLAAVTVAEQRELVAALAP